MQFEPQCDAITVIPFNNMTVTLLLLYTIFYLYFHINIVNEG